MVKPEWMSRFKREAEGHLREMVALMDLLDWERKNASRSKEDLEAEHKQLRLLFIKAHSIKGTAGMIGMDEIAAEALELENRWGELLLDPTRLNPQVRRDIENYTYRLTILVEALKPENDEPGRNP